MANPDLVERIMADASLNPVDYNTLYTPSAKGCSDFATMADAG